MAAGVHRSRRGESIVGVGHADHFVGRFQRAAEQVQPFTQEQVESLLKAARSSPCPKRDEAIVLFLYDTGVRASELCILKMSDLDLNSRHARVLGKGCLVA